MQRSSRYYTLTHSVHVYGHLGFAGWEVIAAFNCEHAALAYAKVCAKANPNSPYGISCRVGRRWSAVSKVA